VSFGEKELFISVYDTVGANSFYTLPEQKWATQGNLEGSPGTLLLESEKKRQKVPASDTNWVAYSWYSGKEGFVAAKRRGELYVDTAGVWKRLNRRLPDNLIKNFKTFCFPPEPANAILGVTNEDRVYVGAGRSEKVRGESLYVIRGSSAEAEVSDEVVNHAIMAAMHVDSAMVYFRNSSLVDSFVYVPFAVSRQGSFDISGLVKLRLIDLSVSSVSELDLDGLDRFEYDENCILTLRVGKDVKSFVVVRNQPQGHGYYDSWSVWELSIRNGPRKIGDYPFIAKAMPESRTPLSSMFWSTPNIGAEGLRWLPPDHLIISWNDDAIYNLNISTAKANRFWYSGGEAPEMHIAEDGHLALYAYGTRHLWVFPPE
jgi:hypothetical protein